MLRLKGCPRCKGDILIDRDHLSWYEQCIQCGYLRDFEVSGKANGNGKKDKSAPDRIEIATEA
jgi:hypothetical protein